MTKLRYKAFDVKGHGCSTTFEKYRSYSNKLIAKQVGEFLKRKNRISYYRIVEEDDKFTLYIYG